MNIKEFFNEVGGNYESVISRLPSENMIKKFVCKFVDDSSYEALEKARKNNNIEAAFLAAHTLKGTAANLGLDMLAEEASNLTEKLRNADCFPPDKDFETLKNAYEVTIRQIELLD